MVGGDDGPCVICKLQASLLSIQAQGGVRILLLCSLFFFLLVVVVVVLVVAEAEAAAKAPLLLLFAASADPAALALVPSGGCRTSSGLP